MSSLQTKNKPVDFRGFLNRVKSYGGISFLSTEGPFDDSNISRPNKNFQDQPKKTLRVLVVDDELMILDLLQSMLTHLKCDVDTCASGEEALQALERQTYDLIFLDILLPGLNGVEVLRKIRENHVKGTVCMMTGFAREDLIDQALQMGAMECLRKPFTFYQIKDIVNHKLASL